MSNKLIIDDVKDIKTYLEMSLSEEGVTICCLNEPFPFGCVHALSEVLVDEEGARDIISYLNNYLDSLRLKEGGL